MDTYVSTFFDLYGLHNDFPGHQEAQNLANPIEKARRIESRLHDDVVKTVGCRADRFAPHIQPYEFEGLLFSDVDQLVGIEPTWADMQAPLAAVRAAFFSPEHINDGQHTHPSERLSQLEQPRYKKVLHGPRAVQHIGLARMTTQCMHFAEWMAWLETRRPL